MYFLTFKYVVCHSVCSTVCRRKSAPCASIPMGASSLAADALLGCAEKLEKKETKKNAQLSKQVSSHEKTVLSTPKPKSSRILPAPWRCGRAFCRGRAAQPWAPSCQRSIGRPWPRQWDGRWESWLKTPGLVRKRWPRNSGLDKGPRGLHILFQARPLLKRPDLFLFEERRRRGFCLGRDERGRKGWQVSGYCWCFLLVVIF